MPRKKEDWKLRLKNGSEADATGAYLVWRKLEEFDAHQLEALAALAEGDGAKVTLRTRAELMTALPPWFSDDGALDSQAKNVIQSAVRDSADGKVVVTPFLTSTQKEVDLLTEIHHTFNTIIGVLFEKAADQADQAIAANRKNASKRALSHVQKLSRELRRQSEELKKPDDPGYSRPR